MHAHSCKVKVTGGCQLCRWGPARHRCRVQQLQECLCHILLWCMTRAVLLPLSHVASSTDKCSAPGVVFPQAHVGAAAAAREAVHGGGLPGAAVPGAAADAAAADGAAGGEAPRRLQKHAAQPGAQGSGFKGLHACLHCCHGLSNTMLPACCCGANSCPPSFRCSCTLSSLILCKGKVKGRFVQCRCSGYPSAVALDIRV
jgi:hypothetical protein